MSDFGNGVAVAIEALQDELDLLNVFWRAAPEATRPDGVVDVRVRRHGSQAQGGAQANAMGGHLINAVLHHSKALRRRVTAGVHLVGQLLHQRLQLVELGIAGCKVQEKKGGLASKAGLDQKIDFRVVPSMVSSSCLR
jgi:hypothetical protein